MVIILFYNVEEIQHRYAVQGSDTTMFNDVLLLVKKYCSLRL